MDNHYHIMIETPDANLSMGMRQLNGIYTQKYNKRHQKLRRSPIMTLLYS
jgi:REP element-mobilizing transposase RayT